MKKPVAMFFVAIAALAGCPVQVAAVSSDVSFGVAFENYVPGEELSDEGAFGGTWGRPSVPKDVETSAELKPDGTVFMSYGVADPNARGAAFVPKGTDGRSRREVELSIRPGQYEDALPEIPDGVKTGLAVYAPDGVTTSFVAWVGASHSWTNLQTTKKMDWSSAEWYTVAAKFMKRGDGRLLVQYALKQNGSYAPLKTEDGAAWLDLGASADEALVRKVEFCGNGGLEYMNGGKPAQGLYVGVGSWYQIKNYETTGTTAEISKGEWQDGNRPAVDSDNHAYAINVPRGGAPNVYVPETRRAATESVEVAVRFESTSRDESIPDDGTYARVRLVAEPGMADTQPDPTYRFACLVNDGGLWGWKTNTAVAASLEKDYVLQLLLDSERGSVSYRVKGSGYDGGAYVTLAEITGLPASAFGNYSAVYFEGSGLVYKIKTTDRTKGE